MKTYICPDCGQKIDNNLHDCPNCGCPATMLVWEFVGNDVSQPSFKRKKTIPVNAISSTKDNQLKI